MVGALYGKEGLDHQGSASYETFKAAAGVCTMRVFEYDKCCV